MATFAEPDTDQLTIRYHDGGDGWVTATIAEEPAAISQGRTREEARENVLQALRDLHHDATPIERLVNAIELAVQQVRDRVERRLRERSAV